MACKTSHPNDLRALEVFWAFRKAKNNLHHKNAQTVLVNNFYILRNISVFFSFFAREPGVFLLFSSVLSFLGKYDLLVLLSCRCVRNNNEGIHNRQVAQFSTENFYTLKNKNFFVVFRLRRIFVPVFTPDCTIFHLFLTINYIFLVLTHFAITNRAFEIQRAQFSDALPHQIQRDFNLLGRILLAERETNGRHGRFFIPSHGQKHP